MCEKSYCLIPDDGTDHEHVDVTDERLTEGAAVIMVIRPHDHDRTPGVIRGELEEALSEGDREFMERERRRVMADMSVRDDDGVLWTFHVDNGYVTGPVDAPGRPDRSDVGKFTEFALVDA